MVLQQVIFWPQTIEENTGPTQRTNFSWSKNPLRTWWKPWTIFSEKCTFYTQNFAYNFREFTDTLKPWTLGLLHVPIKSGLIRSPFHLPTERCHSSASNSLKKPPQTASKSHPKSCQCFYFFPFSSTTKGRVSQENEFTVCKGASPVNTVDSVSVLQKIRLKQMIIFSTITMKADLEIKVLRLKPTVGTTD